MPVSIHESWTKALSGAPETGMGYQVIALPDLGTRTYAVVANARQIVEPRHGRFLVFEGSESRALDGIVHFLQQPMGPAQLRVLNRSEAVSARMIEASQQPGSGPAQTAPVVQSDTDERFLRFSAFADDVRIQPDGSVTPETYVTTHQDGMTYVKTGMDAVRRYAMPNPVPAVHRFYLKPPTRIQVQRGITQPANGQPGGGVEVIFVNGSPPKSLEKQDQIPPGEP